MLPRRPVLALFPLLALILTGCGSGSVQVPVPTTDSATAALCARLDARLPATVHGQKRRDTSPKSPLVAAWGDPAIALRCGVPRPSIDLAQLKTKLLTLDGDTYWLPTSDTRPVTFIAIGRQAYVEVTVPASYQQNNPAGDVLLEFLPAIRAALPALPDNAL